MKAYAFSPLRIVVAIDGHAVYHRGVIVLIPDSPGQRTTWFYQFVNINYTYLLLDSWPKVISTAILISRTNELLLNVDTCKSHMFLTSELRVLPIIYVINSKNDRWQPKCEPRCWVPNSLTNLFFSWTKSNKYGKYLLKTDFSNL